MHKKSILPVVALVSIVNALGYGIIIPVIYQYSRHFGLNDFQNGLLFAIYSVCQFVSTPIIGRLSDKYGRKPLLSFSILGTAISFFMMAFAPNAIFLFFARALDGVTAGNIPVISAIITDSTSSQNRAKGFGILGASFGLGFVLGPAISGFTIKYSLGMPFVIAGVVSLIAVIATVFLLPETNSHKSEITQERLFNFKLLFHALFDQPVGSIFLITLLYSTAFSLFTFAFQPFSLEILGLAADQVAMIFTIFGIIGLVTQGVILPTVSRKIGLNKLFKPAILVSAIAFSLLAFTNSFFPFVIMASIFSLANSFLNPITQTLLSTATDSKSQGSIQGLNTSYMSIGQIIGPILGGAFAILSFRLPFLMGGLIIVSTLIISSAALKPALHKENVF